MSLPTTTKKAVTKKVTKPKKKLLTRITIEPASNGVVINVERGGNLGRYEDIDDTKIICVSTDATLTCLEELILEMRNQ